MASSVSPYLPSPIVVPVVTGTVTPGFDLTVPGPTEGSTAFVMTELDIYFNGGTSGNLTWTDIFANVIFDWRPGSTEVQSEHWSGFQILPQGASWVFDTGGSLGFNLSGWGWQIPWRLA